MTGMASVGEITHLLREVEAGREGARDKLWAAVYADLERMAHSYLHRHFGDQAEAITLQPADLVNESLLKLIQQRTKYDNSGHFLAIASRVMLRVLIDYRRRRGAAKRGGGDAHITLVLDEQQVAGRESPPSVIEVGRLGTALETLESLSARKADVVKLRVIWGLDLDQVAESLGVSRSTVGRDWRFAKAWLAEEVRLAQP